MATIRVTKMFDFEMAHALLNYDGLCKNVHGHSYKLHVTVIGEPIQDPSNPKQGMIIDFSDLKRMVKKEIIDVYDHAFMLNKEMKNIYDTSVHQMFSRTMYVDYQPTCENMVADFALKIKKLLPDNCRLFSVRLYETATSFAEWFASDNE